MKFLFLLLSVQINADFGQSAVKRKSFMKDDS